MCATSCDAIRHIAHTRLPASSCANVSIADVNANAIEIWRAVQSLDPSAMPPVTLSRPICVGSPATISMLYEDCGSWSVTVTLYGEYTCLTHVRTCSHSPGCQANSSQWTGFFAISDVIVDASSPPTLRSQPFAQLLR